METPVINERLHFFAYYPLRAASILFQQPLFSSSSFSSFPLPRVSASKRGGVLL
jgi:hypothetical protein